MVTHSGFGVCESLAVQNVADPALSMSGHRVTILRDSRAIRGAGRALLLGGDTVLEGGQALGEPGLLGAPELWFEFSLHRCRVRVDIGHVRNGFLGGNGQLARRRRGAGGHLLGDVEKILG